MSNPATPVPAPPAPNVSDDGHLERTETSPGTSTLHLASDPAMIRICIELFTRAALYAGAVGLIAGLLAALLFRE